MKKKKKTQHLHFFNTAIVYFNNSIKQRHSTISAEVDEKV